MKNDIDEKGQVYINGTYLTIEEVKDRYSLAISINHIEVMKILYETDKPLTINDICKKLSSKEISRTRPTVINGISRLQKERLVTKFYAGRSVYFLLTRKGALYYQTAKDKKRVD